MNNNTFKCISIVFVCVLFFMKISKYKFINIIDMWVCVCERGGVGDGI